MSSITSVKRAPISSELSAVASNSPCSLLQNARLRFLQFADDFTLLNPHLALSVNWQAERLHVPAGSRGWKKWFPSDPTPPHWYDVERFERLLAAYVARDAERGVDRTVREFVSEFRGLSGTAKQKAVLAECGLARTKLSELAGEKSGVDRETATRLLAAMKTHGKAVPPQRLGVIGHHHLETRFKEMGCEMDSFRYRKNSGYVANVPWVLEAAFAWRPEAQKRRIVTGINFSPSIGNPFRALGACGESLDSVLAEQRVGRDEPVVFLLHLVYARAEFSDRGKSTLIIERS